MYVDPVTGRQDIYGTRVTGAGTVYSPDRLTQVLDNLLENAVSFSPAGGTVTVSLHAEAAGVAIVVADQGPGIPEEHLERAFARFFSYRPDADHADSHSGLGLAIVRAIVEGYGGAVTLANRPGGGAEARVSLPRAVTAI